jgi:hypothetical protein
LWHSSLGLFISKLECRNFLLSTEWRTLLGTIATNHARVISVAPSMVSFSSPPNHFVDLFLRMEVLVNGGAAFEVVERPCQAFDDFKAASVSTKVLAPTGKILTSNLQPAHTHPSSQKSNSPKFLASILRGATPPAFPLVPPVPHPLAPLPAVTSDDHGPPGEG